MGRVFSINRVSVQKKVRNKRFVNENFTKKLYNCFYLINTGADRFLLQSGEGDI